MINHVGIQVADMAASRAFYETFFAPLGISVMFDHGVAIGFAADPTQSSFWLSGAERGETREIHVAFTADSRATVDAVHAAAVAAGIEVLHAPRVFPEYHENYYAVFVRDPDGHNIEAVNHNGPD
jgi:catechol 2,3-dioxygenase-like lactoylglutathione lyase family enzyme